MIYVQPEAIVDFWSENLSTLKQNYMRLAVSEDGNTELYLTCEDGHAEFSIEVCGSQDYSEQVFFMDDLQEQYEQLLHVFIDEYEEDEPADEPPKKEEDDSPFSEDEKDRLESIRCSVEDLLCTLLDCRYNELTFTDQAITDLAYRFEKTLLDDFGIVCDHPTIMEDGTISHFPFGTVQDDETQYQDS